jgi:nucleoside-diphosphate-sugar epimerase
MAKRRSTRAPARGRTEAGARARGLTVAVTGATGDIGRSLLRALDPRPEIRRVVAMARRPFEPSEHGLRRTEYRQGDVLDPADVRPLVKGADVVVHLAFVILGDHDETTRVNLDGSRSVFEAAVSAGASRLVYTSSVAAYGFHADNPPLLTEDVPARGTEKHYYSAQKAALEGVLQDVVAGADTDTYVFRPCIVAGPDALVLLEMIPYVKLADRLPAAVLRILEHVPALKPVIPDPGVPFQLVHHDDVASALRTAVLGKGEPGVYNLAAADALTIRDLADALGWYSVPVPELAVDATAELVARLPFLPAEAQWIEAFREPALMDTRAARSKLRWRPRHTARDTLQAMIEAARAGQLVR